MCTFIFSIEIILPSKLAPANRSQHQLAPAAAVSAALLAVSLAETASTCCHAAYASFNLFYLCVFKRPIQGAFFSHTNTQAYQPATLPPYHNTLAIALPYPFKAATTDHGSIMPLAQPKEKQDHGLSSPGLGLDKPYLTLDHSCSHDIALALGLGFSIGHSHGIAMALASPRHWPLAVLWGLLSRVLLLERIFLEKPRFEGLSS